MLSRLDNLKNMQLLHVLELIMLYNAYDVKKLSAVFDAGIVTGKSRLFIIKLFALF